MNVVDTRVPDARAPLRLLKVVPTLLCGGTENQVMALCRSLNHGRTDLEMACLRRLGPFVKEIDDRRIPLAEYPIESFYSLNALAQQAKFARHLTRRRTQIVHAYNFYGNVFAVPPARLAGTPVVIASIRDLGLYLTPMQKRVQRYVCKLADRVLVNADAVKDWLVRDGYAPEKIVVIPNGVDVSRFSAPREPSRLRCELELPPDVPLVAVVSRLTRLKGLEQFLEAAALVGQRFPQARFLVVGETPPHDPTYLDDLKALAGRLCIGDRVIFTGLRSDVPALLANVTVSVMPSLNEALSNALLESMAAGAPIVATRVGGTPEVLTDGKTGLLVPAADVPSLATSIARLLDAPILAAQLGRAARQVIEERYSITRMAATTENLYRDLLTRHARKTERRGIRHERAARETHGQWLGTLTSLVDRPALPIAEPACSVHVVTDDAEFLALEAEWNETVERARIGHPFLRHEWLRTWWECFGRGCRLHILIVRRGGRIAAIAPLLSDTTRSYGISIRRLRLLHNDHTPRADFIVAEQPEESYRAIWKALCEQRDRWDVLQLSQLPEGSPTLDTVSSLAAEDGCLSGVWPSGDAPYVRLAGNWDEYYSRLSSKFRQNVRNRLSRLTRLGEPALETVIDGAALLGAREDAFRLEASGWKAEAGTSIDSDPAVHRFYALLAERASQHRWLHLLFLTVNGERIATSYGARYGNRLFLFKTGYDPAHAQCSPFKLLIYFAVRHAFAEGLTEVDFLGDAEPWKLEWTPTTRAHHWLFVFANTSRARVLHHAKFRLAPVLKRWRA
ncbi:MAG: hypothetical protein AUH43_07190 [Acidobacteria bacterium 13_1_40CM_65_14]|nr:MAG: hypothetical protein AUH43_07190 [Acidobacteria bacterium 13_1_40CM_65_14]